MAIWKRGAGIMVCTLHYQPVNQEVGYCWKCLAGERDPPAEVESWWWASAYAFCQCTDWMPSATGAHCVRCGLPLLERTHAVAA